MHLIILGGRLLILVSLIIDKIIPCDLKAPTGLPASNHVVILSLAKQVKGLRLEQFNGLREGEMSWDLGSSPQKVP